MPSAAMPGPLHSAALSRPAALEQYLSVEQALRLCFPDATEFRQATALAEGEEFESLKQQLRSPPASRFFRFHQAYAGERLLGWAVVEDVLGKSEPFTFLVALDLERRVLGVELLVYRESHGGEVRHPKFREQFNGKRSSSPLRLDDDIRNIAGATISCRSLIDGVHDVLVWTTLLLHAPQASAEGAAPPASASDSLLAHLPAARPVTLVRSRLCMNSPLRIELDGARAEADSSALYSALELLESCLSAYREQGNLARLNRAAAGEWVALGEPLEQALLLARELGQASGGAFDIGLGALSRLAKSGVQSGPEWDQAQQAAGSAGLELRPHAARRLAAPLSLDLGALGKGLALDAAVDLLRARGCPRAVLDFGGQIAVLLQDQAAAPELVEVRDPGKPKERLTCLALRQGSLAVSADDQRALVDGSSHLIDPRTRAPLCTDLACAVVFDNSAARADGWSSALYVLGFEAARERVLELGLAALLFTRKGERWTSAAFQALERESP